jgi:hypothetical protein
LGSHKGYSFPDKERFFANFCIVTFVTIENGPDRFVQNAKNLNSHKARLFDNGRISPLRQAKTSEHSVTEKPEAGADKISLAPLGAPAQGAVGSEKWNVERLAPRAYCTLHCLKLLIVHNRNP